ncbi:MAG TPA: alpha/beta hydrolase, partial [Pseudomonadota bacterium]|nr:alpha/beta hydrolase [Pseudomonadota bacterium]
DLGAPGDYLAALGHSTKPAALLVGADDELFYPDRFGPLLRPARSDLHITIVPGMGHIGMIVASAGIAAVRKSFLELTGQPGLQR